MANTILRQWKLSQNVNPPHFPKEHEAQFLALCPLCAAKYKEFVKGDEDAIEQFREELVGSKDKSAADELTLPLRLGEHDTSIRFVETHWKDMKTILPKIRLTNHRRPPNTWRARRDSNPTTLRSEV